MIQDNGLRIKTRSGSRPWHRSRRHRPTPRGLVRISGMCLTTLSANNPRHASKRRVFNLNSTTDQTLEKSRLKPSPCLRARVRPITKRRRGEPMPKRPGTAPHRPMLRNITIRPRPWNLTPIRRRHPRRPRLHPLRTAIRPQTGIRAKSVEGVVAMRLKIVTE